jgi:hypothetical protein
MQSQTKSAWNYPCNQTHILVHQGDLSLLYFPVVAGPFEVSLLYILGTSKIGSGFLCIENKFEASAVQ